MLVAKIDVLHDLKKKTMAGKVVSEHEDRRMKQTIWQFVICFEARRAFYLYSLLTSISSHPNLREKWL